MKRVSVFIYGIFSYLIFSGTFIYLILFVGDLFVAKTINSGATGNWTRALFVNLTLITLFGIQHTVMTRKSFKEKWTRNIANPIERSTYVLLSSLALLLLLWFWQPITATVWQVEVNWATLLLQWGFLLGWLVVFLSTWMIDHFDLFGVKQVWNYMRGNRHKPPDFMEPGFHKYVRHPLMMGFLIAFWSTPHMTVGHLVFSAGMTLYIFTGVYLEEKTMKRHFGEDYEDYKKRVSKIFPLQE